MAETGHKFGVKQILPALILVVISISLLNLAVAEGTNDNGSVSKSLFDGHTLTGWKIAEFTGHSDALVESNSLIIVAGEALSGITFTNQFPTSDYEISLEAMRVSGSDFFCGLTFPVLKTNCTLIVGGWGGRLIGISSIDGRDASENEFSTARNFTNGVWYSIRLQVTTTNIHAWLNDSTIVDVNTKDRELGLRLGEISLSRPLGLATYTTKAALRNIRYRLLSNQ